MKKYLLLLLVLFGLLFADGCDVVKKFGADTWQTLSAIAIAISILIVSALFMFGKLLDNTALVLRAKTDAQQIIATAVILAVFSSFILTICSIDMTELGFKEKNMFRITESYFNYVKSITTNTYIRAADSIMLVGALSSFYGGGPVLSIPPIPKPGEAPTDIISFSVAPFSGLSILLSPLQFSMNFVMLQISIAKAQLYILKIIEFPFLTYLLPIGVVLRCFTPFREFGGALIAISIGLFLFYPFLFSVSHMIVGQPQPKEEEGFEWKETALSEAFVLAIYQLFLSPLIAAIDIMVGIPATVTKEVVDFSFSLGESLLVVFILPALNWIVIVAAVRSLSKALGTEIDISTLARLI